MPTDLERLRRVYALTAEEQQASANYRGVGRTYASVCDLAGLFGVEPECIFPQLGYLRGDGNQSGRATNH